MGGTIVFDNILIATDGSDEADNAAEYAIELASGFGATVHVLYVVETQAHYFLTVAGHDPEEIEEHRAWGEDLVTEVVDTAAAEGLDAIGAVKTGSVAQEIVEYADEKDIDHIVIGATGRSGIDDYLVGSTAEKVVRTATVPVTTVRLEK